MIVSNIMFNMKRMPFSPNRVSRLFKYQTAPFCCKSQPKPEGMDGHDDFKAKAKITDYEATKSYITKVINENDVVLFMKGNPKMPQCGFSNYIVQIFKFYGLKNYFHVNVLESSDVREGIKKFSNWPTIPQVYIKKEFIGGCDIIKEMHVDGSLEELLIRCNLIKK